MGDSIEKKPRVATEGEAFAPPHPNPLPNGEREEEDPAVQPTAPAPADGYSAETVPEAPRSDPTVAHPVLAPPAPPHPGPLPKGERGAEQILARFGFTGETLSGFLEPVPEPDRKKTTTRVAAFLHENGLSHFGGATPTEKRNYFIRVCHSVAGGEVASVVHALVALNRAGAVSDFLGRISLTPGENPLTLAREVFSEAVEEIIADFRPHSVGDQRGTTEWTSGLRKMRSLILAGFHREALERILFVWMRAQRFDGTTSDQATQTAARLVAHLVSPHTEEELRALADRTDLLRKYGTARRIALAACTELTPNGRLATLVARFFPESTVGEEKHPLALHGFTEKQIDRLMEGTDEESDAQSVRIFSNLLKAGILDKLSDQPDQARKMFVELLIPFSPQDRVTVATYLEVMCLAGFDMAPIVNLLQRRDIGTREKLHFLEQKLGKAANAVVPATVVSSPPRAESGGGDPASGGNEGTVAPEKSAGTPSLDSRPSDLRAAGMTKAGQRRAPAWDEIHLTPRTEMDRRVQNSIQIKQEFGPAPAEATPAVVVREEVEVQRVDLKATAPRPLPQAATAGEAVRVPAAVQRAMGQYMIDTGLEENEDVTLEIDMGRKVVEKTISRTIWLGAKNNAAHPSKLALIAQGLSRYYILTGRNDVASDILQAVDRALGPRLLWDRRLGALAHVTPNELLSLNPLALDALKRGEKIWLIAGEHHYSIDAAGYLWNPFRIVAGSYAVPRHGPPAVELILDNDTLVLLDAKGSNGDLLAKTLKEQRLVRWSPEIEARMVKKEPAVTRLDEKIREAIRALQAGLAFYLQETHSSDSVDLRLDADSGTKMTEITIRATTLAALKKGDAFFSSTFVSLAQGILTFISGISPKSRQADKADEIATELIMAMNRQFGHRLAWDRRIAAFKTMTLDDLLATDRASAEALRQGIPVTLGGANAGILTSDKEGWIAGEIRLSLEEPESPVPSVNLRMIDGKVMVLDEKGHRAVLLSKALAHAGLANLSGYYRLMRVQSGEEIRRAADKDPDVFFEATHDFFGEEIPETFWIIGSNKTSMILGHVSCPHLKFTTEKPGEKSEWIKIRHTSGSFIVADLVGVNANEVASILVRARLAAWGDYEPVKRRRPTAKTARPAVAEQPSARPTTDSTLAQWARPGLRSRDIAMPPAPDEEPSRPSVLPSRLAFLITEGAYQLKFRTGDLEKFPDALKEAGLEEADVDIFMEDVFLEFRGIDAAGLLVALCQRFKQSQPELPILRIRDRMVTVLNHLLSGSLLQFERVKLMDDEQIALRLRSLGLGQAEIEETTSSIASLPATPAIWLASLDPQKWEKSVAARAANRRRPTAPPPSSPTVGRLLVRTDPDDPKRTKGSVDGGLAMSDGNLALSVIPATSVSSPPRAESGGGDPVWGEHEGTVAPEKSTGGQTVDSRPSDLRVAGMTLVKLALARGLTKVAALLARLDETQLRRLIAASAGMVRQAHHVRLSRVDRLLAFVASRIGAREDLSNLLPTADASLPATSYIAPTPAALGTGSPVLNLVK